MQVLSRSPGTPGICRNVISIGETTAAAESPARPVPRPAPRPATIHTINSVIVMKFLLSPFFLHSISRLHFSGSAHRAAKILFYLPLKFRKTEILQIPSDISVRNKRTLPQPVPASNALSSGLPYRPLFAGSLFHTTRLRPSETCDFCIFRTRTISVARSN